MVEFGWPGLGQTIIHIHLEGEVTSAGPHHAPPQLPPGYRTPCYPSENSPAPGVTGLTWSALARGNLDLCLLA